MASMTKAAGQPAAATASGTSWIETIVSRKPTEVWMVNAVPVYSGGLSSVIEAENWAESATTETPQTSKTAVSSGSGAVCKTATSSAMLPLTIIAALVVIVRPMRSALAPATRHPIPPLPITAKASKAASVLEPPPVVTLSTKKIGTHVHIAYAPIGGQGSRSWLTAAPLGEDGERKAAD